MRLILRLLGTWLLGLAVILVVIDGTRSLAANGLALTPLAQTWAGLEPQSLAFVHDFLETRFFGPVLNQAFDALIGWPGWAVLGLPGLVLVFLGRSRAERLRQFTQI
jgi:hypothetical protein